MLGQKVKFRKELVKRSSHLCKREETVKIYQDHCICKPSGWKVSDYPRWGVKVNEEDLEGFICGKRMIDLDGEHDGEGCYEGGHQIQVYLIATKLTGFHRVPEEFIITEEE